MFFFAKIQYKWIVVKPKTFFCSFYVFFAINGGFYYKCFVYLHLLAI